MYRFLLSRRWIGFAVFVIFLAALCVVLGQWQFDRLGDRENTNELVRKHLSLEPVPLQKYASTDSPVARQDEWRRLTATGTYDVEHEFALKYQSRDEGPGVEIVTPLVLASGDAILVNRGWLETQNNSDQLTNIPPPPTGKVTVVGWLRPDSEGETSQVTPTNGQVRGISSRGLSDAVAYDLYRGYLDLRKQSPASMTPLAPAPKPDLGDGRHFFYGLQWWFFGVLSLFGLIYFARAEAKENAKLSRRQSSTPSVV